MSLSRAPARDTSETPSPRERIRSHMKMVISQLEGILIELKDVAKELREVRLRVSLHIIRLPGVGPGGGGRRRRRHTGGRMWVPGGCAFSSRVRLIKCEIPLAAWRF